MNDIDKNNYSRMFAKITVHEMQTIMVSVWNNLEVNEDSRSTYLLEVEKEIEKSINKKNKELQKIKK